MARHQRHFLQFSYIPCTDDQSPAIGVCFYLSDQFGNLVHYFAINPLPTSPLFSIYRAEFSMLISPFIPDTYIVFFQVTGIGFPF